MGKIESTYALVRLIEERRAALLAPGQVLVYRSVSRFPWIDLIFDLEPGTRCMVLSADYDSLNSPSESDAFDNHYYYTLEGLEDHGGIVTTEIVAMFDLDGTPDLLEDLAAGVSKAVLSYRGRVLGQILSDEPEELTTN